jgi:PAS domain S-box-containing protein
MKWFLNRSNTIRFGVTIAVLIGIALISTTSFIQFQRITWQIRYRRQIISQLGRVLSSVKDAETGQRGYLLTGRQEYLLPYQAATSVLGQEIEELVRLTQNEPIDQQQQIAEMKDLIDAKLAELEQTIRLRQSQKPDAALAIVESNQGKQLMDQIRAIDAALISNQQRIVDQQAILQRRFSHLATFTTIGGVVLELLLVTGTTLKLNQETQNLKQSEQDLLQSEQRYRSLVTATAQVVWLADATGQIQTMTPGWYLLTGQTEETAQGMGWLAAIQPDERASVEQRWQAAIEAQEFYETEYQLLTVDGNERIFLMRGVPVIETNGVVREWVGTCVDITPRKQAEQVLQRSRDQLEQEVQERTRALTQTNAALQTEIFERMQIERQLGQLADTLRQSNQELEQFAYVASHDLQEPLRAVANYTQLLARKYSGNLDEKADKYIGYIVDGATRMQQLINDLLTYSRVGRQTLNLQEVDTNIVCKRALDGLRMAIAENNAVVTHDPLPTIVADAAQITQLFQNLLSNAIKYRDESDPQIHISANHTEAEWTFSVKDNGIGIDPQYAERIFVIFQRLHTRRDYSGTGIGLAICKKIVELHKGQIWVESESGKGSTFYFTIPHPTQNLSMPNN